MMNKKQLLLDYLDTNLFMPIMYSPNASYQLKHDFEHSRELIQEFSAEGILRYVWTMMGNEEVKAILNNRLLDEGFTQYNTVVDNFKHEFTYDWLMS